MQKIYYTALIDNFEIGTVTVLESEGLLSAIGAAKLESHCRLTDEQIKDWLVGEANKNWFAPEGRKCDDLKITIERLHQPQKGTNMSISKKQLSELATINQRLTDEIQKLSKTIDALSASNADQKKQIDELKKQLENSTASLSYSNQRSEKLDRELDSIHLFLDGLQNSPPKEVKTGENSWDKKDIPLLTRLTIWIVNEKKTT